MLDIIFLIVLYFYLQIGLKIIILIPRETHLLSPDRTASE